MRSDFSLNTRIQPQTQYPIITEYHLHRVFLLLFWCTCPMINISVRYSGKFPPDIILLPLATNIGEPV